MTLDARVRRVELSKTLLLSFQAGPARSIVIMHDGRASIHSSAKILTAILRIRDRDSGDEQSASLYSTGT